MVTVATVQSTITADVAANGTHIRALMQQARAAGADLAHFTEGALSGYVKSEVHDWDAVDWAALRRELEAIRAEAARLGLWVVLGCNHRLPPPHRPQNSLYVIAPTGRIAGRYNKRLCSNTEITWWYTPGTAPLVFDVGGIRFGTALCIEVVFPALFAEYEALGVQCCLLSSYSIDPTHALMARAHAATNCFWVSQSTPVACSMTLPSQIVGPDGVVIAACPAGAASMVLHTVDPGTRRFALPLTHARPWRARARSGEIYAGLAR